MTDNELKELLATIIAPLLCDKDYAAVPYCELNSHYKARVDKIVGKLLDALTPMMSEVVDALKYYECPLRGFSGEEYPSDIASKALTCLPDCWKGNV
jgi:hypothetical protein